MREQPIWLTVRFWNTAFFEAIQTERDHRLLARQKKQERRKTKQKANAENETEQKAPSTEVENDARAINKPEISTSSSSHQSHINKIKKERSSKAIIDTNADVDKEMENISFRLLT